MTEPTEANYYTFSKLRRAIWLFVAAIAGTLTLIIVTGSVTAASSLLILLLRLLQLVVALHKRRPLRKMPTRVPARWEVLPWLVLIGAGFAGVRWVSHHMLLPYLHAAHSIFGWIIGLYAMLYVWSALGGLGWLAVREFRLYVENQRPRRGVTAVATAAASASAAQGSLVGARQRHWWTQTCLREEVQQVDFRRRR